jgi:phosphoenolpyruvate synthase/pyruvate phosphate dikinase
MKEEIESLKIVEIIKKDNQAKKLFLQKDVKKIEDSLDKVNKKLKKKILKHFNKWRWVPYTYMGPAYYLDYYLEIWSGIIRQKIDINKELRRLEVEPKKIKNIKQQFKSELKISAVDMHLINIATDIIYLKAYRKDCWFYGCFVAENLYKEIGRRLGLSLNQVWMMAWWEVAPALTKGKFNQEILNERVKFSVLRQVGEKGEIYIGKKARDFLKSLTLEKIKIVFVDKLSGTAAYVGKAKGRVKIINLPEEMNKMEKGNIMVSHTTFPSLVPAMKKAAAIVTDDGGITCHAAIVARELKTPCVVGTKIATQVLKDGDLVEVDANNGVVKILKK